jgi:Uma2 family endonuclease
VVQPDLLVVCNPQQIKRTHIEGAPALAVEIESESSAYRDRLLKLNLYARTGVKEYWIVRPWPSLVEVLLLQGAKYQVHEVFGKDQILTSPSFPGLQITLVDVFDFPLEPDEKPPVVKEPPGPRYNAGAPSK